MAIGPAWNNYFLNLTNSETRHTHTHTHTSSQIATIINIIANLNDVDSSMENLIHKNIDSALTDIASNGIRGRKIPKFSPIYTQENDYCQCQNDLFYPHIVISGISDTNPGPVPFSFE